MGCGFTLKCDSCKYELTVYEGIGFRYPLVCEELLTKIKHGKFGSELQEAAKTHANAAIHQDRCLLRCDNCGWLEPGEVIDVCIPLGEAPARTELFCAADREPRNTPYVMSHEIGVLYSVVNSLEHHCPVCKGAMHPVKMRDHEKLMCPECNAMLSVAETIMWD